MARPRAKKHETATAEPLFGNSGGPLSLFLPVVSEWFRNSVGEPTDAQARGWPLIHAGKNTLIVAPTGSGKTLAAFLAGLDTLWRQPALDEGVQILYISPLKALNEDIHRNLDRPLSGVAALAHHKHISLPEIKTAVRTGDTSTSDRQAQIRRPPHVLITTPESLHLILGGRARSMLKSLKFVIVDELHALAGQKRGTFLAILLERLVHEIGYDPVRIGLTATVNPVEDAAAFLGGFSASADTASQRKNASQPKDLFQPRHVTIVRSVVPKAWDLRVSRAEVDPDPTQPRTIWPSLEKEIHGLIEEHQSTLVFANNRYLVERLAAHINDLATEDDVVNEGDSHTPQIPPDQANGEADASAATETMPEADDVPASLVHAHHGSISLERRRQTESMLKNGQLRGVISTASLEMGIDMGAVDLVCQVGSPGEVARGLQRVGRAGHAVGAVSKGRFFARTNADLLEMAALVEAMSRSAVEPLAIPQNCLDMLAQQVVACVAVRPWKPRQLFCLFRSSYPYQNLSEKAFEAVLEMLAGRFRVDAIRDLRARIYWDRLQDELIALPGTASLALTGGGAIPDTGQYPVKLGDTGPTLGSLDEEFVLERRAGECFRLGSSTWRIDRIDADKVVVSPSGPGAMIVMPFWRGEESRRSATLGAAIGGLVRKIAESDDFEQVTKELIEICCLDDASAEDLARFVRRQKRLTGATPDDRTIIVEAFADPSGEVALAILSPWGGRVHQALKIVLQSRVFEKLGIRPAAQHCDDGLIMRLPRDSDNEAPLDILDNLTFEEAADRLKADLADSALFGLRFRQNASRAMLLPRPDPGKRTPLWLQRLRAKDLLQVVRQMPDFPIVLECYRECLSQDLDLDLLKRILDEIKLGKIRVVKHSGESASPFAADLMNRFERKFLYEWDEPNKQRDARGINAISEPLPSHVLEELLDRRAIERMDDRKSSQWLAPARSAEEMAERLGRLGDMKPDEVTAENAIWLEELKTRGLAKQLNHINSLWIASEETETYEVAFSRRNSGKSKNTDEVRKTEALDYILSRFVKSRTLISLSDITGRYPVDTALAAEWLGRWTETGGFVRLEKSAEDGQPARWADARNFRDLVGSSLAERRREIRAIEPETWVQWVLDRHFRPQAGNSNNRLGEISSILMSLQGWSASLSEWEEEIIGFRLRGFQITEIDRLLALGDWDWRLSPETSESTENPEVVFWNKSFAEICVRPNKTDESQNVIAIQIMNALRQFPERSAEIALRHNITLKSAKQALIECLRKGLLKNERVAFLPRWFSARTDSNAASVSKFKIERQGQRRVNQFRQLLIKQGVGVGGTGPGKGAGQPPDMAMEGMWLPVQSGELKSDDDFYAAWAALLIARYGVVCRETVKFAATQLDWPLFSQWLEAAEWRGELRRGYFVEGLSGLQFTDEPTMNDLVTHHDSNSNYDKSTPFYLISAVDPLNLYGASAPLDLPLLENGRAKLPRIAGNSIVFHSGLPIWIVQERGQRITLLPHGQEEVKRDALQFLIQNFTIPSTKWTIETIDGDAAAKSSWAKVLMELGFFRDGLALTRYRGLV